MCLLLHVHGNQLTKKGISALGICEMEFQGQINRFKLTKIKPDTIRLYENCNLLLLIQNIK